MEAFGLPEFFSTYGSRMLENDGRVVQLNGRSSLRNIPLTV